ncbi:DUF1178 family protein [Ancylobacter pratisalsi]|uniref:DUF1178 family protein n=1 Tax=Ancylobacter pratisalsi TaxID=1745854 RepID=A0A6P1YN97_9HYPH|nr:DUF1178 family protein [Ancylobacter pratisalsi]QIB33244.1 DUF1178 family protein [Ancylobacter pratisalsi]
MILYRLRCAHDHHFESWFRDSSGYDEQRSRGLVSCPACGSTEVEKAIMAPALGRSAGPIEAEPVAEPAREPAPEENRAQPVALMSQKEQELRAMLKAVREHVLTHSDYVGGEFAQLARRMHEGDEEKRLIHGEASPDEVRALIEDEIEVLPLPVLPDERN